VNRVGTDGNDTVYSGASVIYDGLGSALLEMDDQEAVQTRTLSYADIQQLRIQLPFLKDKK
jgi:predicted amidohydrolase